ncbi:hypothetical protein P4H67_22170 [Paenibacillus lautus]|nr:hypothetical protein [Paenibacillus lautus]MEC0309477.1 hypothetical protein [Paenibacillus lautus]
MAAFFYLNPTGLGKKDGIGAVYIVAKERGDDIKYGQEGMEA